MIKQADKNCKELSTLILNAIHEIANTLTGENEKDKILETLDFYISMDINRLSYNNIFTYKQQDKIAGLIIAYDSNKVAQLDRAILKHLESKNIFLDSFDEECFENEFYIDSVAVSPEYQGRGIAKELIKYAENEGREHGYEKMSLIVHGDKEKAYSIIEGLVERFTEQHSSYTNSDYNETLTRRDFIDPFFKALGWDVDNSEGYAESYREVIKLETKINSIQSKIDYCEEKINTIMYQLYELTEEEIKIIEGI